MREIKPIPVETGDAFTEYLEGDAVVVEDICGAHGNVRYVWNGRRVRVQVARLQNEYMRLGVRGTKRAHKRLALIDKRLAART